MQSGNRGFALLIVLWSLVLVGLITTQIVASGRTSLVLAGNVREAMQARAAADGAINEAIFHMLANGADRWQPDGTVHVLNAGGMRVAVQIDSLAGKINPNLASTALLAGLFQAIGAAPGQARQIAESIIQWRSPASSKQTMQAELAAYRRLGLPYGPPGHDFSDISELADVANMPPVLLANALPHLSLYQSGDPDPAVADPAVRQALALSGQSGATSSGYSGNAPVFAIQAVAGNKGLLAVRRQANVSMIGEAGPSPFQLLSLTDGY